MYIKERMDEESEKGKSDSNHERHESKERCHHQKRYLHEKLKGKIM